MHKQTIEEEEEEQQRTFHTEEFFNKTFLKFIEVYFRFQASMNKRK